MNILAFGEIIWDCFPGGHTLGGAPLNFAVHAARLGARTALCSAVGEEDAVTVPAVAQAGVDTRFIKKVPYPTGHTDITLDDYGVPTYHPFFNTAWEHIPTMKDIPAGWDGVYFGTFAQRGPDSAAALRDLLHRVESREIFCDLNLRQDGRETQAIALCLEKATLLKVNEAERTYLNADIFAGRPRLKAAAVTLGPRGAELYLRDGTVLRSRRPRNEAVSTVGAGDAFSAGFFVSWLLGEPPQACLDAGVSLSDEAVTRLGAF